MLLKSQEAVLKRSAGLVLQSFQRCFTTLDHHAAALPLIARGPLPSSLGQRHKP